MVPVLASAQLTSEMQGAGQRGASFPRLGSGKARGTWAVSIQGKKELYRATTDPEDGLLWGGTSATGDKGLLKGSFMSHFRGGHSPQNF